MRGVADEDFLREMAKAEAANDQDRVEALHLAHNAIVAFEFEHIETVHQVRTLLVRQIRASEEAEARLERYGV